MKTEKIEPTWFMHGLTIRQHLAFEFTKALITKYGCDRLPEEFAQLGISQADAFIKEFNK